MSKLSLDAPWGDATPAVLDAMVMNGFRRWRQDADGWSFGNGAATIWRHILSKDEVATLPSEEVSRLAAERAAA